MTKIHLTGETGQQVPAGRKNGEYTGQNQNSQQIRIVGDKGQHQQRNKEKQHNHPTGQYKDFGFY
jgi:hypothetical protein